MFSHLPSDIVAEILLFLSPDEIFPKCLVSRVFASVCRDEHFWRRVWLKWISPNYPLSINFRSFDNKFHRW